MGSQDETWVVNLWLGNDEPLYRGALALDLRSGNPEQEVREFVEESVGSPGGMRGDLLNRALGHVVWRDVAETVAEMQGVELADPADYGTWRPDFPVDHEEGE